MLNKILFFFSYCTFTELNISDITIFSLNTKGFNELRQDYVTDVAPFCNILCIQEHWLLKQYLHKIDTFLPNFKGHSVSGMPDHNVLLGRPYGGCAILWQNCINHNVTKLPMDNNRACAIRVTSNDRNIIIVCVYLPTDTQTNVFDQIGIEMILADIRTLRLTYPFDDMIVAGDFNVNLNRNTPMVEFVNGHMSSDLSLSSLWQYYNVDFTYESVSVENSRSTLDHFYVSQGLMLSCYDAGVLHHVHNTSDHSTIYVKFKLSVHARHTTTAHNRSHTAWHKASHVDITNYNIDITNSLRDI